MLDPEYFDLKINKSIPVDEFIEKVLYHPNIGYHVPGNLIVKAQMR